MVAKAHSNPFSLFMRKIGFSVGLENTLQRIDQFAHLYAASPSFSVANVKRMLHDAPPSGWGLKNTNEHILDVMRSLGVFTVKNGEFNALETGDALGICMRMRPERSNDFVRFLFVQALVRADGDVFLNGLAARFEPEEFRSSMVRLLEHKRNTFERLFRTREQRTAIYRALNIEQQELNQGNSKGSDLLKRKGPSPFAQRASIISDTPAPEVVISEAYIRKALPRRKAWAVALGLANEDGALTPDGERFIETFALAGYSGPSCMAMWPLKFEIDNSNFSHLLFPPHVSIVNSWSYMLLIRRALGGRGEEADLSSETIQQGLDILTCVLGHYRELNNAKSILRRELPVRIGYLVTLALAATGEPILPIPSIVENEQRQASPVLMARPSRFAEYALSN
ncbi:hypothetical protein RMR10_001445 [Agrobacterium rosae]|uniref:hypothetical protein n=1 Tax=Agrobacterium rosae TaxID=1972867 RepID=UPI002A185872|nr:hypothetical protein [Agrobacterium rosae]MDX8314465.1 hypothetical protein [Agrobacterium rosae]